LDQFDSKLLSQKYVSCFAASRLSCTAYELSRPSSLRIKIEISWDGRNLPSSTVIPYLVLVQSFPESSLSQKNMSRVATCQLSCTAYELVAFIALKNLFLLDFVRGLYCSDCVAILYDTVTIQYNTIQYNTIQYNTIQYNKKYNTIQYNTIPNILFVATQTVSINLQTVEKSINCRPKVKWRICRKVKTEKMRFKSLS